ncbi:hypothetical protein K3495_g4782 [Podosphaera aphanis]|nr:hypothetical protein K3495_g4782 [Podosphaera aphanis]
MEDLLMSIRDFNESMFQLNYNQMLSQEKNKLPADFKAWIDDLREKLSASQHYIPPNNQMSRSTFASLQGIDQAEATSNKDPSSNSNRGEMTLNKKRKGHFKSNQKDRKKQYKGIRQCPCAGPRSGKSYQRFTEARHGLDAALKRHEELMKNKSGTFAGASFRANVFAATKTVEVHPLENSYIADIGADSHIINSSYSYIAARKALPNEIVASGKDHYPIESIGTATVNAHGPNAPVKLILYDVASVPGYFTNM